MDSSDVDAFPPHPIYDAVRTDCGWSPAELREPFDLAALVAASYGTVIAKTAVARSRSRTRARRRDRPTAHATATKALHGG
jgi:hypothetical protein